MAPAEFDQTIERIIRNFAQHITVFRMSEFDAVWDVATGVCDRYELTQCSLPRQSRPLVPELSGSIFAQPFISSEEPSAVDAPAQIPPRAAGYPDFL
jgi:hypothetical protein